MKLLNSLEFKSIVGGECVGYTPNGLIHAFKPTDAGCASWVCSLENKGSSWRNSHWYRPNVGGSCAAPTEKPLVVEEFVEMQQAPAEIKLTLSEIVQPVSMPQ